MPGCRLTYLARSEKLGVLGGLSFVAAPMRLRPRDAAVGWSIWACGTHLPEVVAHDRFLLAPGVQVSHLASHGWADGSLRGRGLADAARCGTGAAGNLRGGVPHRHLLRGRRFVAGPGPDFRTPPEPAVESRAGRFEERLVVSLAPRLARHPADGAAAALGRLPGLGPASRRPAAAREFGRSDLPEGCRQERTVPTVQDTTALNFTSHATVTSGLGP